MQERQREVRAQSGRPAKAGAASSGAASSSPARPAPYARAPPPKRQRSRPPVQSVTAKADVIIDGALTKRGLGPTSQATATAAVALLGSIPKASGADVCGQAGAVPYNDGNDGHDYFWLLMIALLLNMLLVIEVLKLVFRREPELRISYAAETRGDAEASADLPAPIPPPVVILPRPPAPDRTRPIPLTLAQEGASASADNAAAHSSAADGGVQSFDRGDGTDLLDDGESSTFFGLYVRASVCWWRLWTV